MQNTLFSGKNNAKKHGLCANILQGQAKNKAMAQAMIELYEEKNASNQA